MKLESIDQDGEKTITDFTNDDIIKLYDSALAFCRVFTTWIMQQSERVMDDSAIKIGPEFQALLDALKVGENYEREDTEEDIAAGEEYARQQAKERASNDK